MAAKKQTKAAKKKRGAVLRGGAYVTPTTAVDRAYGSDVKTLTAGNSYCFDRRGCGALVLITESGGTATVSRVNSASASAHVTGTGQETAPAATISEYSDWGFYYVTAIAQTLRAMVV